MPKTCIAESHSAACMKDEPISVSSIRKDITPIICEFALSLSTNVSSGTSSSSVAVDLDRPRALRCSYASISENVDGVVRQRRLLPVPDDTPDLPMDERDGAAEPPPLLRVSIASLSVVIVYSAHV